ncbi:uncharacterized protein Ephrin isoform X3 [Eurosta solidaginis]|uniref:uncharacterized protein Ephrin isoform X3 n=1 Tax=Eurosta solidaginis TaxID=178769 RepID=UPI003530B210
MKLCHSNNPNTMHDTNMCTADKPLFATGNAGDLKYLENKIPDKMFRDIKDVSTKNKKTVLSDSVQNQKVTSKGIIFSFDVETAIICRNKSRQSIGFPRIKYRNCKTYRNQLRNTMVTALEDPISWNPRGLSINKIVLTRPSEVERVTSLLATPYLSSSSSLSMSSTLEVPFLIQTSLEFSVFSTQAWYQYLLLLVINLIKLSDAMRINSPVTSRETKKIVRIDNWPQRRLTVSKISSALPKRIVYSHPESRCKIRASVIPSGHSSTGSSSHTKFRLLPGLRATSFCTLLTLIFLETVLLSTVSNCAKTFYMHWNTSNSIFRIDNTDHIIDVNKGNLAFEFDQVHIICPVYEPGTFENETEKYIIYNVSKVEYETCRITNADPRVIAICDKPQKLMFFTITFRPFTPQPGGLEFLPGNDYYFIYDHFDKHPNEVVKNEELTYNSGAMRIQPWIVLKVVGIATSWHIANLSKWLLFRSRWILPSVSNINRDKGNEEQMNSQFTTQNSFYIREKGKRKIKATVKFLSFNFKEILIFFIVLFAITLLMIKFSLNSRERLNDKTNLKRTSMENFGLSNENTFVPHSWLDRFYPYTKQKFVFIELKLFHHHKLEGLTSQPAEGTIVSIKNTQPSESIQAENNKYFLSTMLIQPLIKYCHSHLLNVCVKVKKCR